MKTFDEIMEEFELFPLRENILYEEFKEFILKKGINKKDLHTKIGNVAKYGKRLYEIVYEVNPNIFSEETVEELSTILADFENNIEWEYIHSFDFLDDFDFSKGDAPQYSYPLWSLEFILDLNPSLINENSFCNLLQALNKYLISKEDLILFHSDYGPPNPLNYFSSLLKDTKRYTFLLINNKLSFQQLEEMVKGELINVDVIIESEKYLHGDNYENALFLLKNISEIKPEYILLGWRNDFENLHQILPFTKNISKENFLKLTENIKRYNLSSSISVPLAIGGKEINDKCRQDLAIIANKVEGCKPEIGYYFASAILNKNSNIITIKKFISSIKNYFSLGGKLEKIDNKFCNHIPKISNLNNMDLEKLIFIMDNSKIESNNLFRVDEKRRFDELMERIDNIPNTNYNTLGQRFIWLNTFESVTGNIDPNIYFDLLFSKDDSFHLLWEKMQEDRLYEFDIKDKELKRKIKIFRNKYMESEKESVEYTEEAQIFNFFKSEFETDKKNIDVIFYSANVIGINPFVSSQITIEERSRKLYKNYHPDVNNGEKDKFNLIIDSKELLLNFIKYRDKKIKDKFGSTLPKIIYSPSNSTKLKTL